MSHIRSSQKRTPQRRRPPPAPGEEARRAVEDVLRDQATRAGRREGRTPPPPRRRTLSPVVLVALAAITLWVWLSPTALFAPEPLPEPTREELEAGLRMELYVTYLAVEAFAEATGSLPPSLDALPEEADPDVTYQRRAPGYVLEGGRGPLWVSWRSDEPLTRLLGDAPALVLGQRQP